MVIELPVIPKSNGDEASFSSFFAPDTPTPSSKPDDMEEPKGQLNSKGLFGVIVSTKKPTIFLKISVLASKKSSNQTTFISIYLC